MIDLSDVPHVLPARAYCASCTGSVGVLGNIGLYSTRYKRFADLPAGARVAIANNPKLYNLAWPSGS